MNKIKLLIVEDDPIIASDLERSLSKMGFLIMGSTESGEDALEAIEREIPDLILMDIQLEGDLDGIDTAHIISKKHLIPIIYLTSNSDQATFNRAKLTQPYGVLSKPFRYTDIRNSIDLAFIDKDSSLETSPTKEKETLSYALNGSIFVKDKDHLVKIKLEDILYVEADSCYCTIQTIHEKHVIVSTLKKFIASITYEELLRIHRSYIVHLRHIDKIGDSYVMVGDKMIPIGRSYRESLFGKIHKL